MAIFSSGREHFGRFWADLTLRWPEFRQVLLKCGRDFASSWPRVADFPPPCPQIGILWVMIIHNKEFYGIWWLGVASFKSAWMQKWLKFRQPLPSSAENPATSPLNMKHWQHPPAYLSYQWRALPGVDDKDGRMKRWPKRDAAIEDRIWEFGIPIDVHSPTC